MSISTKKYSYVVNLKWSLFCAMIFASHIILAQSQPSTTIEKDTLSYEEFELTEGDTAYIMKKYFLLTYLEGENRDQSEAEAQKIQQEHMAHMDILAKRNKISIAGPFGHDGLEKGIIIFNAYSIEEAEEMAKQDPAVVAGRLRYTLYPIWLAKGSTLD